MRLLSRASSHSGQSGKLKPRPPAWRKAFLYGALLPIVLILVLSQFPELGFGPHHLAVMLLLVLLRPVLAIQQGRRSQPPLRDFREDEHGTKLVVRHRQTREVLLRSSLRSLAGVEFQGAVLDGADLREIDLCRADLREASLRGADLRGCKLNDADFTGADLSYALIAGAQINGTSFEGADLRGADLLGHGIGILLWNGIFAEADLNQAELNGAVYNAATRWPPGFRPAGHGLILDEEKASVLPIPAEWEAPRSASLPLPAIEARRFSLGPDLLNPISESDPDQIGSSRQNTPSRPTNLKRGLR